MLEEYNIKTLPGFDVSYCKDQDRIDISSSSLGKIKDWLDKHERCEDNNKLKNIKINVE